MNRVILIIQNDQLLKLRSLMLSNLAMVSTWMGDHSGVEVDAAVKNTVKSQEWRIGTSNIKTLETKKL